MLQGLSWRRRSRSALGNVIMAAAEGGTGGGKGVAAGAGRVVRKLMQHSDGDKNSLVWSREGGQTP